jgi:serine protease inhibitor
VVSPLSVTCALYLLAAATDGAAQQEILDLLEIGSDSDSDFESFSELIKFLLDQNDESYILNIG